MKSEQFLTLKQHLNELQSNFFVSLDFEHFEPDILRENAERPELFDVHVRAALTHLEMTAEAVVLDARRLLGKPDDIAHRSADLAASKVVDRLRPFMQFIASNHDQFPNTSMLLKCFRDISPEEAFEFRDLLGPTTYKYEVAQAEGDE